MRIVIAFIFSLILIGCGGYQPVVKYSKHIFAEPVFVKVKIDPEDPKTGEYLQDEITKMAINRLNLILTQNVNKAKNYILVNSYTVNTTPVTKDNNGNVIRYSINAAIEFAIKDKYGFWSKNIVASEYVSVKAQSLISATAKDKATKLAIKKALDDFVVAVMQRANKVKSKEKSNQADNNLVNSNNIKNENIQKNSAANNGDGLNIVVVDDDKVQNGLELKLDDEDSSTTTVAGY